MIKQADAIYIVTMTPARAEALKQAIDLRDFDEIVCVPYENAALLLKANPPALALIDTEGDTEKTVALVQQLNQPVKSIILSDRFDEDLFVTCHDKGNRDFLITPVPDAYLVSRIIRVLQECRLEQQVGQKDRILEELGVLSERSGVFTTSYLLKLLKDQADSVTPYGPESLSLLLVQLNIAGETLPEALQAVLFQDVARILRECARGFDIVGEYFMDKFAVILPQTGERGAKALARRLQQRLKGYTFGLPSQRVAVGINVGLSEYAGCRHYEDLLNRALSDLRNGEAKTGSTSTL